MKLFIFTSVLSIVGSCATKKYSERIEDLKNSIVFEDRQTVEQYASTITSQELMDYVYELSSDQYQGRKTGETGLKEAANYLKDYYIAQGIPSPFGNQNYFQPVPKSFFTDSLNSSQNVVAYIEGSKHPKETIIITAHLDHEGEENGEIYNGADDNASGTAALMEMAEAFNEAKKNGNGPKRSILFLHLTGEEEGLIGSKFYVEHPIVPLKKTIANLNIDMIGRVDETHMNTPNYVYVIGADRLSKELYFISETANTTFSQLDLDYRFNDKNDTNHYFSRSDQYNFAQAGIPVIFYFNGEHEDYHKPTDTAEKLNYPLLAKRTQLIFATAWYLANSKHKLTLDQE
ncbi:M28 family metallopeptidase [Mangrovimonas sp. DI 80]|uniref:M28 family metallopeptidase n=1 Tax=Mangrovimonas sp. DI 80 TaxID=1779330 RepID=UPI0009789E2D|nr:M28 family metallopeptidase [Mangrovimonas sp. DI 80]OMP29895.1 peptidase M28 [Mangrovimonas sp. DI 80]